jgi:dipeptidyl-peptidase III
MLDQYTDDFKYESEQFADIQILRFQVPGFIDLSLKQKELTYYLYQAALSGRDIFYDQNYRYNLIIRRTLEAIIISYTGDKNSKDWKNFITYTKRIWFSNGIHHHYSTKKFLPDFGIECFKKLINNSDQNLLPLEKGQTVQELLVLLCPIIFDANVDSQKVVLAQDADMIKSSATNFYGNISQNEVEGFYKEKIDNKDNQPVSHGLNSKLIKETGGIFEQKWKEGEMYSAAIEKIIFWLEKAVSVAENEIQSRAFGKLIEFYKSGNLKIWDEYNIIWIQDTESTVDTVNGFIEVYNDPLGYRGSFESIVSIKDFEATKRIKTISDNAQWFEDHSPIESRYKKKKVVGISAKAITVVVESGDASPSTPIGINLPNSRWIRKEYGSKSVNLSNIVYAYDRAASQEALKEFSYSLEEVDHANKYGPLADNLETDMHEAIGHASGQIMPGVATPKQTLKNYASAIEESRADLVALYYLPDSKLVELGLFPNGEAYKAEYEKFIRNGLMLQLFRIKPGENIEESHMRNRQLISKWAYEMGKDEKVIEKKIRDRKTYFVINDYDKLRKLFGQLLKEVQRITSEGDFAAAKNLVETYGVRVDQLLHKEVLERYSKIKIAPYKGFINPVLKPVLDGEKIIDVLLEYPDNFMQQMLYYAKNYSFLPNKN